MSTLDQTGSLRRMRLEARLASRVASLYRSWPVLSGFAVRKDLMLSDVTVHPWVPQAAIDELSSAIALALAELVEDQPDAETLIRGRTFARCLN